MEQDEQAVKMVGFEIQSIQLFKLEITNQ